MSIIFSHIILLTGTAMVSLLLVWFIRYERRQSYMDDIDTLFEQTWSGREGEELYAWYLIKSEYLEGSYGREEYIRYINKKINEIDKSRMMSNYSIDEFGNIEDLAKEKRTQLN